MNQANIHTFSFFLFDWGYSMLFLSTMTWTTRQEDKQLTLWLSLHFHPHRCFLLCFPIKQCVQIKIFDCRLFISFPSVKATEINVIQSISTHSYLYMFFIDRQIKDCRFLKHFAKIFEIDFPIFCLLILKSARSERKSYKWRFWWLTLSSRKEIMSMR